MAGLRARAVPAIPQVAGFVAVAMMKSLVVCVGVHGVLGWCW
jgi:hypothetical protein